MPIRDHRQLIAWQLANELRSRILRFTSKPPASRNPDFCQEIRAASGSVCRNITEGFYRYHHPEFARFLDYTRGSLGETKDGLQEALQSGYVTETEFDEMWIFAKRCTCAVAGLHRHLKGTTGREPRKISQSRSGRLRA